jgi:sterol desaturase/sphingolipid hydroxylase (fatty acid hydroxylase superfamily)
VLRALREHHARHHIPRLMQRANFNVTIPLCDWLFGTLASSEEARRARERATRPLRRAER